MKVQEIISEAWYTAPLAAVGLTPEKGTKNYRQLASKQKVNLKNYEEKIMPRLGGIGWILKTIGYVAIVAELWAQLDPIDKDYQAGKMSSEDYKVDRQRILGIWTTAALAPWLTKVLRVEKIVNLLVRFVLGVATLGGTVATGGALAPAAITGMAVETAVFLGVQQFLMSDAFKNWVAKHAWALTAAEWIGTPLDAVYDELRGLVTSIPGVDKFVKNPGDTFYQSQKKERDKAHPEMAAKEKDGGAYSSLSSIRSDPNSIVIAGYRVDDGAGGINPMIANGPQVQNAIDLYKNDPTNPDYPAIQKYLKLAKSK